MDRSVNGKHSPRCRLYWSPLRSPPLQTRWKQRTAGYRASKSFRTLWLWYLRVSSGRLRSKRLQALASFLPLRKKIILLLLILSLLFLNFLFRLLYSTQSLSFGLLPSFSFSYSLPPSFPPSPFLCEETSEKKCYHQFTQKYCPSITCPQGLLDVPLVSDVFADLGPRISSVHSAADLWLGFRKSKR